MSLPPVEDLTHRATELLTLWRVPDREITIAWNRRLRTSAGRAFVRHGRVELNPNLLATSPDQVQVVLTHEVAHIAAWRLFGPAAEAHGRQWRALMRMAGASPSVTHDMPVGRPRRKRPRHLYLRICDSCGQRRIMAAVRYGRCHGCSRRDSYLVLRAPATRLGRAALERLSLTDARARCGTMLGAL